MHVGQDLIEDQSNNTENGLQNLNEHITCTSNIIESLKRCVLTIEGYTFLHTCYIYSNQIIQLYEEYT